MHSTKLLLTESSPSTFLSFATLPLPKTNQQAKTLPDTPHVLHPVSPAGGCSRKRGEVPQGGRSPQIPAPPQPWPWLSTEARGAAAGLPAPHRIAPPRLSYRPRPGPCRASEPQAALGSAPAPRPCRSPALPVPTCSAGRAGLRQAPGTDRAGGSEGDAASPAPNPGSGPCAGAGGGAAAGGERLDGGCCPAGARRPAVSQVGLLLVIAGTVIITSSSDGKLPRRAPVRSEGKESCDRPA